MPPIIEPVVGHYTKLPQGMPVGAYYERDKSYRVHYVVVHVREKWDVNQFLKNRGSLSQANIQKPPFFGSMTGRLFSCFRPRAMGTSFSGIDPWGKMNMVEVSLLRLSQILQPGLDFKGLFSSSVLKLVLLVAHHWGEEHRVWRPSAGQYDSCRVSGQIPYVEEVCLRILFTQRHRAARFVSRLRLNHHSLLSMIHYATLQESVMRAFEAVAVHKIHHAKRAQGPAVQSSL